MDSSETFGFRPGPDGTLMLGFAGGGLIDKSRECRHWEIDGVRMCRCKLDSED